MKVATRHFVRPEFMNHHQTLYAGYISEWVTEAAMIGVTEKLGTNEQVVLAALKEVVIKKEVVSGMILQLDYEVSKIGVTSIEILVEGKNFLTGESHLTGRAVFVTVDENGEIVDGDKIMYIIGSYLSSKGLLEKNTIVTTVMSNLGFHKALDAKGIQKEITAVGDRYVVEEMRKSGYNLGGEQSGHVVIMDYNTTGDGQLTGVQLTKIMQETGKKLSELAAEVTIYPQKLVNIRVENSMKDKAMEVPAIREIIEKMEAEMAGNGRILVRPSGTEPLLRVMAEAPTHEEVDYYVDTIAAVVQAEIGL